jgi:hypothetical protein
VGTTLVGIAVGAGILFAAAAAPALWSLAGFALLLLIGGVGLRRFLAAGTKIFKADFQRRREAGSTGPEG